MKKAICDAQLTEPDRTLFARDLREILNSQTGQRKRCLDQGVIFKLQRKLQCCRLSGYFTHIMMRILGIQRLFELSLLHVSNGLPTLMSNSNKAGDSKFPQIGQWCTLLCSVTSSLSAVKRNVCCLSLGNALTIKDVFNASYVILKLYMNIDIPAQNTDRLQ